MFIFESLVRSAISGMAEIIGVWIIVVGWIFVMQIILYGCILYDAIKNHWRIFLAGSAIYWIWILIVFLKNT